MAKSGLVEFASHTHDHHIHNDANGIERRNGESEDDYLTRIAYRVELVRSHRAAVVLRGEKRIQLVVGDLGRDERPHGGGDALGLHAHLDAATRVDHGALGHPVGHAAAGGAAEIGGDIDLARSGGIEFFRAYRRAALDVDDGKRDVARRALGVEGVR